MFKICLFCSFVQQVGTKFSINIPVASCPEYYFCPLPVNPGSEGLNVILHITGKIIGYLT